MPRRSVPTCLCVLSLVVLACENQPGERPGRRMDDGTATNAQRRETPTESPAAPPPTGAPTQLGSADLDNTARFEAKRDEPPAAFSSRARAALDQLEGEIRMLESQIAATANTEGADAVAKARKESDEARKRVEEAAESAGAEASAAVVAAINRARQSLQDARRRLERRQEM